MMSSKPKFAILVAVLVSLPVAALAQARAPEARKSLPEVVSSLSTQGYRIREIEMDDGYYEASVIDPKNVRGEVKIDSVTGEIIRFKPKD